MKDHGQSDPPRILVVEDDEGVARMLSLCLRRIGFEVTHTATGGEALSILKQDHHPVVILDLNLPDGQGGAVLDWLRGVDRGSLPAWVVISALGREEATRRYGSLGSNFLAKPFDPWELVRTIEEQLLARGDQPR